MGILDSLSGLTGGQQSGLAEQVIAMLTSNSSGGLAGLAQQFKNAGLGDVVSSWTGTGQNLPISVEQITQALGHSQLSTLASKAGMSTDHVASSLTQLLPNLVDQLTPGGTVPSGASLLSQATSLLGRLTSKG